MLRILIDKAPTSTFTWHKSGAVTTTPTELSNRNPSVPLQIYDATAARDFRIAVDLGNTKTPISGMAFFGVSGAITDGSWYVDVIRQTTAPSYADLAAAPTYQFAWNSARKNFWMPFNEVGNSGTAYYRYWGFRINWGTSSATTAYIGEFAIGLLEAPVINYQWGLSSSLTAPVMKASSIGGVDWLAQHAAIEKSVVSISWGESANDQAKYQINGWWQQTERGLYPLVIIPDDSQLAGPVYYARMPSDYATVQQFLNQNTMTLEFTEAIAGDW